MDWTLCPGALQKVTSGLYGQFQWCFAQNDLKRARFPLAGGQQHQRVEVPAFSPAVWVEDADFPVAVLHSRKPLLDMDANQNTRLHWLSPMLPVLCLPQRIHCFRHLRYGDSTFLGPGRHGADSPVSYLEVSSFPNLFLSTGLKHLTFSRLSFKSGASYPSSLDFWMSPPQLCL